MAFLLLLIAALLSGCTAIDKDAAGLSREGPVKELPLSEYKDSVVLDMYEGSRRSWVLQTKYLAKWPRTDLVKARPVRLLVFDTLGAEVVVVTSDSGSVDEAVSFLAATGKVHARSVKGVDITTDSLRWNKTLNQINTEARVRVISEDGDTLTGRGFISDAKLDNWQILADVKGVFQKVEQRFQDADKDSTAVKSDSTLPAVHAIPANPPITEGALPGADAAPTISPPTPGGPP